MRGLWVLYGAMALIVVVVWIVLPLMFLVTER